MSRPTTTLLLLGLHLIGSPIRVLGAKLRLVNAIYSGPDNHLSLLEWIPDHGYNEEVAPRPVKISFEHEDFDPEIHDCFPNESSAQQAFDKVSEHCVELATVNGNDFRSKPVVPYEDGVYTFPLTHRNQTVRAPVFYIDVDVPVSTAQPTTTPTTSPSSEQSPEATSDSKNDMSDSAKAGIAIGAILLGLLIFGMFAWDYIRTKQKKQRARAAADKGDDHSEPSELKQPEEKQVELGQPEQRVELTGGVREERAELAAETDVHELDVTPQRWKEDEIDSKDWMKNQMVGVDMSVGCPRGGKS